MHMSMTNITVKHKSFYGKDITMTKKRETVTKIIDGDTFCTKTRDRSVRLAGVDAPEKGTKAGTKATQQLRTMIRGKKVEVAPVATDVYGRTVTNMKVDGKSVNQAVKRNLNR